MNLTVFQPSSALRLGFTMRFRKMLKALGDSNVVSLPLICSRTRAQRVHREMESSLKVGDAIVSIQTLFHASGRC